SQAMLQEALHDRHIRYLLAPAEHIPFPDDAFDMVTVASAFHWLDRARFLPEASRVLRSCGWLVMYGNGFQRTMQANPAFHHWNEEIYLARYPLPPRNHQPLTPTEARQYGFCPMGKETYTNEVVFSPQELANYLMTQSTIIAAVEQGTERAEST